MDKLNAMATVSLENDVQDEARGEEPPALTEVELAACGGGEGVVCW